MGWDGSQWEICGACVVASSHLGKVHSFAHHQTISQSTLMNSSMTFPWIARPLLRSRYYGSL